MITDNKNEIFDTEHLQVDLKGRSIRGGAITISGQILKFIFQIISTAVLARIISPADFGLVAMVSAITGFVLIFKDLGLSMATVQQEKINHEQISNLFWVNVAFGIFIFIIMISLSPVIAWFYDEHRLIWITIALSIGIFLGGLSVQHQALLRRQMRFRSLTIIDIMSIFVGMIIAILFGLLGYGYWALIFMQIGISLTVLIGVWVGSGWLPSLPRRNTDVKSMLNFGKNLTIFSFMNYFARNLDNVIIGRVWGANALGLYNRAYSLLLMPLGQIVSPMTAVATPTLSRLQENPIRFKRYYLTAIKFIAYLSIPLIAFMAILSYDIIKIVLGDQWLEAAPIFQILAISAILQPIGSTVGWIYTSLGRTRRMAQWGFISIPLIIISFFIGNKWGPEGVAIAYTTIVCILIYPQFKFALKDTLINVRDIIIAIYPSLMIALFGSIVILFSINHIKNFGSIILIILCGMIEIIIILIYYIFSKRFKEDVKEVWNIFQFIWKR